MIVEIAIYALFMYILFRAFYQGRPVAGIILTGNVAIFFLMVVISFISGRPYYSLVTELAFSVAYAVSPEIYRMITAMFVHASFSHIASNMLIFALIGVPLENKIGAKRFAGIYFISGVTGYGFNALAGDISPGVGASGCIFGLIGAYLALYPKDEIYFPFIIFTKYPVYIMAPALFLIETLYVFTLGSSDNIGHLVHVGGFIGGYFMAQLLQRTEATIKNTTGELILESFGDPELEKIIALIKEEKIKDVREAWLDRYYTLARRKGYIK